MEQLCGTDNILSLCSRQAINLLPARMQNCNIESFHLLCHRQQKDSITDLCVYSDSLKLGNRFLLYANKLTFDNYNKSLTFSHGLPVRLTQV